ncbi:coiled-coil domain-containing protein [Aeoliella mucimassa]|uniref:Chromosome partition protein Smc n=1 Tax=Aeoliella mucimassa TaxID=2527972 RepID=A0A518ANU8_9BACT|nr:hypothetical protein [Aeoliella mucimassa]QDU56406.1 Chromosome partition protein Smc [Aeoliella mucimassa]
MAARQDQTLQIALIVFAIFFVVFAALTYWFWKQWSDAEQRLTASQQEVQTQRSTAGNLQADNETLRKQMGFDPFAEQGVVDEQFQGDVDQMLGTLPEAKRNYRDGLKQMYLENQQLASSQEVDKKKIKDLETKLREVETGHQAQITRLEADKAKIEQDAATQRNQFTQARAELDQSKKELASQITEMEAAFDKKETDLQGQIDTLSQEARTLEKTINKLQDMLAKQDPSFEVADGQITWVNQANNTVWINLGPADALRRQVTFSVFDPNETDAGKAAKKGSVEVLRMLSDHMAECRVTDDDPRDPIMPGDNIYSQVWHRGKPQHFALTGLIDLDSDGRSDLQLAKDLIELNGGVLDAAPNAETGKMEGEMSVETRYLVYGERSDKTNDAALRKTWDDMHADASSLGIELISVTDFMNQMGYKPEDRTVNLGSNVNANDFRPRAAPARGDLRPRASYGQ